MRNAPDLFNKLVDSISPTVFGHQDIKRALLLMLFGGVHNFTHEGVNLREDIDACIVGDPSCAKSQSLKYTSGIVPRSVYTSGKSSSATGLTATVAKEPETAEFCIEVAIHEAMEQQAISITKAVMQATLNARTSILAAVNPTGGHFDKSKPLKYNVVLPPSILSRFDLVYVMIGDPNNQTDTTLRTILGDTTVGSRVAYRMTVRQLEALIRLYEAIARSTTKAFLLSSEIAENIHNQCGVKEIDLSEIQEANHDDGVGALVMRLRQHEEAVMRDGTGRVDKMSLIRKEGYLIVVDYGSRPEAEGDGARQSSSKDDRILAVAPNYVVE
ncbi:DNA replication licensing factor MCM6 [Populus alba]|uniref:DNA replication licensing factor MCM6 n=1 Tax=Populus alba TaxID=43335 RepID=UPI003CC772CD